VKVKAIVTRGKWEATLHNIRAMKKRWTKLEQRVRKLEQQFKKRK